MTAAGMGLVICAAAALEIEEEEKEKEERRRTEKTIASEKKNNVMDWLKIRVQLGHNRTLLHELEEEDIASFNYSTNCYALRRLMIRTQRAATH